MFVGAGDFGYECLAKLGIKGAAGKEGYVGRGTRFSRSDA